MALVVVGRLELLDIGHVDDMGADGGEDDHGGRLEFALEPDGNLGLGQEDSTATTGERLVNEDLDWRSAQEQSRDSVGCLLGAGPSRPAIFKATTGAARTPLEKPKVPGGRVLSAETEDEFQSLSL